MAIVCRRVNANAKPLNSKGNKLLLGKATLVNCLMIVHPVTIWGPLPVLWQVWLTMAYPIAVVSAHVNLNRRSNNQNAEPNENAFQEWITRVKTAVKSRAIMLMGANVTVHQALKVPLVTGLFRVVTCATMEV